MESRETVERITMSALQDSALQGKVALVTGASSGIGAATAVALAAAGASVVLGARRVNRLQEVRNQIEAAGGAATAVELDVTDEASCRVAVDSALREYGRLDIVINNAGVMLLGPILDADTSDWRRMIETNVLGLMYVTHAALPTMVAQGSGDIVNISSTAGRVARSGSGGYNASKFAVGAFTEALRQEVTERGVRVSVVEPGAVDTELRDHITDQAAKQSALDFASSIRALQSDDIARAVLYVVTQPARVAINEVLVRSTDQAR
jgi:NADP-dependent 3-hydroxy acid dehydrogenase YdfG